jgi:hypothetical protein
MLVELVEHGWVVEYEWDADDDGGVGAVAVASGMALQELVIC